MSRPASFPPVADHERHDAPLVAQYAAGDPLDETQQHGAQWLVSNCTACAALVTDLRAVAGAVAWEPVPPRRRDFRIDAAKAEHLRGNALTRFLRGLSLPQARAFRPAAAGVMSIGLLFVVASYAWPGDEGIGVTNETLTAPAAVEGDAALTFAPPEVPPPALSGAADEAEMLVAEPRSEAAAAAPAQQKSTENRSMGADDVDDPEALAGVAAEAWTTEEVAGTAADGIAETPSEEVSEGALRPEIGEALEPDADRLPGENADYLSDADAVQLGDGYPGLAAIDEAGPAADSEPLATVPTDDGLDPASLLLVTGLGLALAGGLLLILASLARRMSDPLLR